jgi:hypothetical protein
MTYRRPRPHSDDHRKRTTTGRTRRYRPGCRVHGFARGVATCTPAEHNWQDVTRVSRIGQQMVGFVERGACTARIQRLIRSHVSSAAEEHISQAGCEPVGPRGCQSTRLNRFIRQIGQQTAVSHCGRWNRPRQALQT